MFFGHTAEIEITKDKDHANKLLNEGWILLDIRGIGAHDGVRANQEYDFVLILGRAEYPRWEIMGDFHEKKQAKIAELEKSAMCKMIYTFLTKGQNPRQST